MNTKLIVKIEYKYGNRLVYPNCPLSLAFTELLQTKTLPYHAIQTIKTMGFTFETKKEEI
jgi:hypothetical protein